MLFNVTLYEHNNILYPTLYIEPDHNIVTFCDDINNHIAEICYILYIYSFMWIYSMYEGKVRSMMHSGYLWDTHLCRGPSQCSVALGCCESGTCIRLRVTELNCWMMSLLWEPRPQSYRHQEKHTVTVHHTTTSDLRILVTWDNRQILLKTKWERKKIYSLLVCVLSVSVKDE